MVNFYNDYVTCSETATISDVAGECQAPPSRCTIKPRRANIDSITSSLWPSPLSPSPQTTLPTCGIKAGPRLSGSVAITTA